MKRVQDTLSNAQRDYSEKEEQSRHKIAKLEEELSDLRFQLCQAKGLAKTQRDTLTSLDEERCRFKTERDRLAEQVSTHEAEKKSIRDYENKRVTDFFRSHFQRQVAADRVKTKDGTLWLLMNAIFTAYPDMDFSKIIPFLNPKTSFSPCLPTLRAQYLAATGQGPSSPAPASASDTPKSSKPASGSEVLGTKAFGSKSGSGSKVQSAKKA